jgi:hypothetical protein
VDAHCRSFFDDAQAAWELDQEEDLPQEFLVRVMCRYSRLARDQSLRQLHACDYHGHDCDDERELCGRADFDAEVSSER